MGQSLYYIPKRDFVKLETDEGVYTIALGKHTIYGRCVGQGENGKNTLTYRGKRTMERIEQYLSLKNSIDKGIIIKLYNDIRDEWQKLYYKLN